MNWKAIEHVVQNKEQQWYVNQKQVAALMGCGRQRTAGFLMEQSVPFYRIGRDKVYFLPEVLEAVEKTRWAK